MQKVIISDTSCLILLDKIGELNLLNKLFGLIIVTQEIAQEFKKELPDWFTFKNQPIRPIKKFLKLRWTKEKQVRSRLQLNRHIAY